jgi:hypothetical protein
MDNVNETSATRHRVGPVVGWRTDGGSYTEDEQTARSRNAFGANYRPLVYADSIAPGAGADERGDQTEAGTIAELASEVGGQNLIVRMKHEVVHCETQHDLPEVAECLGQGIAALEALAAFGAASQARLAAAEAKLTRLEVVVHEAQEWSAERSVRDWADAALLKALWTFEGDRTTPCEGCDGQCDEACAPCTVAEGHANIDRQTEKLVADGELFESLPMDRVV